MSVSKLALNFSGSFEPTQVVKDVFGDVYLRAHRYLNRLALEIDDLIIHSHLKKREGFLCYCLDFLRCIPSISIPGATH